MTWISANWQVLFGGVGTAVVAAVLGYMLRKRKAEPEAPPQNLEAGDHSNNIQVGRDYKK